MSNTSAKHAPGPWDAVLPEVGGWDIVGNGYAIATLNGAVASNATSATARLIAAAPELLAALRAMLALPLTGMDVPAREMQWRRGAAEDLARAAIHKATGTKP